MVAARNYTVFAGNVDNVISSSGYTGSSVAVPSCEKWWGYL